MSAPQSPAMSRSPAAMRRQQKAEAKLEAAINNEIDKKLKDEELERKKNPISKILLLGPGDSGKTTLLKQMKILHGDGFTQQERNDYRIKIYNNVILTMQNLLLGCSRLKIKIQQKNEAHAVAIKKLDIEKNPIDSLKPELVEAVVALWRDDTGIQKCMSEFASALQDTANYFLHDLDRITRPDFSPSDQDILMARSRTTVISETDFIIKGRVFRVIDVGGQTSYRAAWAPYFEDSSAIVFIASMASYDQTMEEDPTMNKMQDSLQLFGSTSGHILLKRIPIILLLNKTDLAEQKIKSISVRKYFKDFDGKYDEKDFKAVKSFFKKKFESLNKEKEKELYIHFTTNTDTKLMKVIIQAILDIVTKALLRSINVL